MGVARLARNKHAHGRLRPGRHARRGGDYDARAVPVAPAVTLYHAPGCHLCERARETLLALLDEFGFELTEIDIAGDARLESRFREWLPVVEIDGERAFVYFVPPDAFRRKLADTNLRTSADD